MTSSDFNVQVRIRRGPGGAVLSVRIFERIEESDEFLPTTSFIADLQSVPVS